MMLMTDIVEAAEAREGLSPVPRTALSRSSSGGSQQDETSRLKAQLNAQHQKMSEMLEGLSAEWDQEQRELQQTIGQLRGQFEEAKKAHALELAKVRQEQQDSAAVLPTADRAMVTSLESQVGVLTEELRREELATKAAREAAALAREAAKAARAEVRAKEEALAEALAAGAEADARLIALQEKEAAQEAEISELRAQLKARPSGGGSSSASDWQEASAEDGRTYYWNTASQQVVWAKPAELREAEEAAARQKEDKAAAAPAAAREELGELRAQNAKLQKPGTSLRMRLRRKQRPWQQRSHWQQAAVYPWCFQRQGRFWSRSKGPKW